MRRLKNMRCINLAEIFSDVFIFHYGNNWLFCGKTRVVCSVCIMHPPSHTIITMTFPNSLASVASPGKVEFKYLLPSKGPYIKYDSNF